MRVNQINVARRLSFLLLAFTAAGFSQVRIHSQSSLPGAALTQPYNFQLVAAAGFTPYTFTLAGGSLPSGITVSPAGLLSGTPTASGDFTFTVQVTDAGGAPASKQFQLNVATTPLIVNTFPPTGPQQLGKLLNVAWQGAGGTAPYNYTLISGLLPAGAFFINSDCFCLVLESIQGAPTSSGTFNLVVGVNDSKQRTATANISFTVAPYTPPSFSSFSSIDAFIGQEIDVTYAATGGHAPLVVSLAPGSTLPPGLTLSSSGRLRGVVTAPGGYNYNLQITDFVGTVGPFVASAAFSDVGSGNVITTRSPLQTGVLNQPYSKQIFVTNGAIPGPWTIASGALPNGLNINVNTGLISGTPTQSGTFNFAVQYLSPSVQQAFTLTISPSLLQFSTPPPSFTTVRGQTNTVLFSTSGPPAPSSFELVSGAWPAGTDFAGNGFLIGAARNNPGPVNFSLRARAADGQEAVASFVAQVQPTPPLTILTAGPNLADGVVGVPYRFTDWGGGNQNFQQGGADALHWSLISGTLPPGLTLYADGNLVGIPTTPGTYNFTLGLLDGFDAFVTRAFTINVQASVGSLAIYAPLSPLPPATSSVQYDQQIILLGGTAPFTWTIASGSLPQGLSLTNTGLITGTTLSTGTFNFTVQVTDSQSAANGGPLTATMAYQLTVSNSNLVITSLVPNSIVEGSPAFTLTINGSGYISPEVLWNSGLLTITSATPTQLQVQVPASLVSTFGTATVIVFANDGAQSNPATFTITRRPPVITQIAPTTAPVGAPGFTLIVTGTNFVPPPMGDAAQSTSSIVTWNGQDLLTTSGSTQASATVPPSLLTTAGNATIRVRNPDGQLSNPATFTVAAPPVLTSLTPNTAFALTGPVTLTLAGTNFVSGARVLWNTLDLTRTFVSSTQLTAVISPNLLLQAGSADVRVINPDGQSSEIRVFTIRPPQPVLTNLTPDRVNAGSPDTMVVLEGSNFRPPIRIDFNGESITAIFDSPTQARAIIDAGHLLDPVVAPIILRTADGGFSNALDFTVTGVNPVISSLSPDSKPAASPAFQLTVNGTSFNVDAIVLWNGAPLVTAFQGSQKLIATVPASLLVTPGAAQITVRNVRDNKTSVARSFAITGTPPSITTVAPNQIPVASPQTAIIVTGANFLSGAIVRLNNSDLPTTFGSATQLTAAIPPSLLATPGVFPVIVRNPDGQFSNPADLTVTNGAPAPQITSLAPPSAQAGSPEFTLAVNGANFVPGATVRWNGANLTTTFSSAVLLTASVPAALVAAVGTAQVTVRNPDQQTSAPSTFTIGASAPPSITTLTPSSAVAGAPAFTLSVQGLNFQNGAIVRWNGVDLTTGFTSSTQLTANVTASLVAAAGTFSVTVRNPDSQVSVPSAFLVTTQPAPAISSLNPPVLPLGSAAANVVVIGTNFQSGAVVRFNTVDLPTAFVTATQLTATIPATLLSVAGVAQITVRNPDSQISTASPLTVSLIPPPVLSSLNPNGVGAANGAFTLTISGANFINGAVILWNGAPLTATFLNSTQLSAAIPANFVAFAGAATIQVRNPDGQTSTSLVFPIRLLTPQITGLAPLSILAGTDELVLTVNAVNVQNGAVILWNGIQLFTTVTLANPTSLPATLRANVFPLSLFANPGTASIAVRNPDGQTSTAMNFYIVAQPPQITSLDPPIVFAGAPGFPLTVRGSGFRAQSQIRWNGQGFPTSVLGPNQLLTTIPAEFITSANSVNITVLNSDGAVSNSFPLTIAPSLIPEITQLTPASAPTGSPSLTMSVLGRNYYNGSKVYWNGSELSTTFGSQTQLAATVPAAFLTSPGAVTITVRNPDGKQSPGVLFAVGEPLRITNSAQLPVAIRGSAYQFNFTATGGARPYKWRAGSASTRLPAGLSLADDGTLNGTPTVDGAFPLTIEVIDATNTVERQNLTLAVDNRDLDISSTSPLPPATAGVPYSFQLRANTSGNLQLAWSVIEGVLPAGLTLNAQTGEISGIPEEPAEPVPAASRAATVPVNFNFRIQVAATGRNPGRKLFELSVLPAGGPFRITTASPLPPGTRERPHYLQIAAVGGAVPYSFTLQGRLPNGVSFSPEGVLDGTPREEGTFIFSITARDRVQAQASQTYEWRVAPANDGPLISSGPLLPIAATGRAIEVNVEAIQGQRPLTWSIISGTLPTGVTFDPVTGRFSGATPQEGVFLFTIRVTDAAGRTDQRVLQLPVTATGEPLEMVTQTLPNSTLGRPYTFTLQARGAKSPYRWTLNSGSLPAGLRLEADQILGIPTAVSAAAISIRLTDTFGFQITREFTLRSVLDTLPPIQITGLPDIINPGQQPPLGVELAAPYAAEVTGRIDLDFAPNPAVSGVTSGLLFNTGGQSADFRIPPGQTRAVFSQPVLALQTGSVAGTVTFRLSVSVAGQPATPVNLADRSVRLNHLAPQISSVTLERRSGGFNIVVSGFSTTRELSEATVVLTPVAGRELQQTRYVVSLTGVFRAWFDSAQSLPFGSQFQLTLPFDGDAAAVQSLTIRLRNSAGESEERRLN